MSDEVTMGELKRSLDRIEAKLDTVTGDHEHRIRRVEKIVYAAAGLALAGTGATGLIQAVGG